MTDAYKKDRDEAADRHAKAETQWCRCAGTTCSGCERITEKEAKSDWIAGADWAMAYERERSKKLVEALKDMIRNSRDIVAKKQCSDYLALYEAGGVK